MEVRGEGVIYPKQVLSCLPVALVAQLALPAIVVDAEFLGRGIQHIVGFKFYEFAWHCLRKFVDLFVLVANTDDGFLSMFCIPHDEYIDRSEVLLKCERVS